MKSIKGSMETKVFCKGSEELKKVITKLIDDKLIGGSLNSRNPSFFAGSCYFALSYFAERDNIPNQLGYTSDCDFYPDHGYIEVSPQEFDKWWRDRFENKEVKSTNSEVNVVTTKLELSKKSPLKILI